MPATNYDNTTPQHKRGVIKVLLVIVVVGALGGSLLGYKIAEVEQASANIPANHPDLVAPPQSAPRR